MLFLYVVFRLLFPTSIPTGSWSNLRALLIPAAFFLILLSTFFAVRDRSTTIQARFKTRFALPPPFPRVTGGRPQTLLVFFLVYLNPPPTRERLTCRHSTVPTPVSLESEGF